MWSLHTQYFIENITQSWEVKNSAQGPTASQGQSWKENAGTPASSLPTHVEEDHHHSCSLCRGIQISAILLPPIGEMFSRVLRRRKTEIAGSCEGCWASHLMSSYLSVPGTRKKWFTGPSLNHFCHHKLQKSMLQAVCAEHIVVSWNDWLPPSTTWKGLQSSSPRNTLFFSIFAKSPPPTFLLLTFPLEENRHFKISLPTRLFYHTIRKYKLSFPL